MYIQNMVERKLKHLEFVQGVINRLAGNSFLIKGWSVTLVAALLAAGSLAEEPNLFFLAYIPVAVFWGLDGYFLWQERLFRRIYTHVAEKDEKSIDFSLDPTPFRDSDGWFSSILSVTILPFYLVLLASVCIVGFSS